MDTLIGQTITFDNYYIGTIINDCIQKVCWHTWPQRVLTIETGNLRWPLGGKFAVNSSTIIYSRQIDKTIIISHKLTPKMKWVYWNENDGIEQYAIIDDHGDLVNCQTLTPRGED